MSSAMLYSYPILAKFPLNGVFPRICLFDLVLYEVLLQTKPVS